MKKFIDNNISAIILILLGFGFLLSSLDIFDFGSFIGTWWPLLLITFGVSGIIENRASIWSIGLLVIGGILQLQTLDVIEGSFWSVLWPVLLIAIGISFIHTKNKPKEKDS